MTIGRRRIDIGRQLEAEPEPQGCPSLEEAHPSARLQAEKETRLSAKTFPVSPPLTLEQALDPDWLPSAPDDQSSTASKGS